MDFIQMITQKRLWLEPRNNSVNFKIHRAQNEADERNVVTGCGRNEFLN